MDSSYLSVSLLQITAPKCPHSWQIIIEEANFVSE